MREGSASNPRRASQSEVGTPNGRIVHKRGSDTLMDHATIFHHVGSVGYREHGIDVLLHHTYGHALGTN